jgi:hypothetical protein
VAAELRLRGESFSLRDLLEYAGAVWSWARREPDPALWAGLFLDAARRTPAEQRIIDEVADSLGRAWAERHQHLCLDQARSIGEL